MLKQRRSQILHEGWRTKLGLVSTMETMSHRRAGFDRDTAVTVSRPWMMPTSQAENDYMAFPNWTLGGVCDIKVHNTGNSPRSEKGFRLWEVKKTKKVNNRHMVGGSTQLVVPPLSFLRCT